MTTARGQDGLLLAGRYRLDRSIARRSRTTLWRGVDEILNRPVAVKTLDPSGDADAFLAAAVAAGRLGHPRIASTYDASVEDGVPYVVSEWVVGRSLVDLLRDGPLTPPRATTVAAQVAEALVHAHDRGVHHLDLDAHNVLLTPEGSVKVTDFALGRAVSPSPALLGNAAALDTKALGALLFACLTGRSAFGAEPDLPLAPSRDGRVCTPRQVRAAVPRELDAVVVRTLMPERLPRQPALTTPQQVLSELAVLPGEGGGARTVLPVDEPARGDRRPSRLLRWGIPSLAVLIVGAMALALGYVVGEVPPPATPYPDAVSAAPDAPAPVLAAVRGAEDFDPQGDGRENPTGVALAFDRDPSTAWETSKYRNNASFGGLKPGVGIVFDLGAPVAIRRVDIAFADKGVSLELRAADAVGTDPSAFPVVASVTGAGQTAQLTPRSGTTARYWLVWITRLVPVPGDRFQAGLAEVSFLR